MFSSGNVRSLVIKRLKSKERISQWSQLNILLEPVRFFSGVLFMEGSTLYWDLTLRKIWLKNSCDMFEWLPVPFCFLHSNTALPPPLDMAFLDIFHSEGNLCWNIKGIANGKRQEHSLSCRVVSKWTILMLTLGKVEGLRIWCLQKPITFLFLQDTPSMSGSEVMLEVDVVAPIAVFLLWFERSQTNSFKKHHIYRLPWFISSYYCGASMASVQWCQLL